MLAGTIGALLAQGLTPYDAARLGVYLHGAAGDVVRDRLGDSGLQAGDLPVEIAFARKRLAAIAQRRARPAKLGFGAVERGSAGGPTTDPEARRPPGAAQRLVTGRASIETGSPRPGWRRCPGPPGSRSTSTARAPTWPRSGPPSRPASGSNPSSRPTPMATARCPSGWRSRPPARTGSRSPRSTRRSSCGRAASARRCSACTPCRPPSSRRRCDSTSPSAPRARTHSVGSSRPPLSRGVVPAAHGGPLRLHLDVETGLGRAGLDADRLPSVVARLRTPGSGWPASGRTSSRPTTRRGRPGRSIGSRRPWPGLRGGRHDPTPSPRRERGAARSCRAGL